MKHVEYYIADDGTKFDYKYKCEAYELSKKCEDPNKHIQIFDEELRPLEVGSCTDKDWQNEVVYYIIHDSIGYAYLDRCSDFVGIPHPTEPHNAKYPMFMQYEYDDFLNVEKEYELYKNVYEKLTKAQKGE